MKIFLISMLSLLLFVSCHDLKKQNQLKKMDALILTISEVSEELKEIDSVNIDLIWNEVMTIRTSIQENYQSDTLSVELGQNLEDYKLTGNQAIWVKKNLPVALKAISEIEDRLIQLRANIVVGNGAREKYDTYIQNEEAQVKDLKTISESLQKNNLEAIQQYQELHDKMVEYSKSLVLKNNAL